jgi:mannose-6-phosphate isomerase-like protein (cupin superfamily)
MTKLDQVHKDQRGEIYALKKGLKDNKEIAFLRTNKGFARGGCIHRINDEFSVILEGKVHYFIGDNELVVGEGELIKIPRNTPHCFISLTDSLIAEWGCLLEEKVEKYKPLKDMVDKINKNL